MKILLFIGLIALILFIVGCGEVTLYDNIGIEVAEYARLPAGIGEDSESGEYRFVTLKISGTPSDHFYGIDALGLINIIDSDNKWCYPQGSPLQGSLDDVLVKETVYLSFLAFCENKEAKSSTFIFYKTPSGPAQDLGKTFNVDLSTVAGKKDIAISESMSAEGLELVKTAVEKAEKSRKAAEQAQEKAAQEQADKEQKIKETQQAYDAYLQECLDSDEAMQACLSKEYMVNEINDIKESYDNCISNPKFCSSEWADIREFKSENCSEEETKSWGTGICLVYYLKPNHNGEEIRDNLIDKILETQKKNCKYNYIGDYCDTKFCANNKYCQYINKESKTTTEGAKNIW